MKGRGVIYIITYFTLPETNWSSACSYVSKMKKKGDFKGTTGERILAFRNKMGMTQLGLANKLHIHRSVISLLENDKREMTANELYVLSEEFNVSHYYLLCQTDSQSNNAECIKNSSLIENEQLLLVIDLFQKQIQLYADEYLSKLSPERQEDLAIHLYKLLSPKGK